MQKNTKYLKIFVCINALLNIIILFFIAFILYEANKYMYFAGFGSLLVLVLFTPYFLVLCFIMILLLLSIKLKKRVLLFITMVLQIICCLLWLFIIHLFFRTVFEIVTIFQIITAITILCLLWHKNKEEIK